MKPSVKTNGDNSQPINYRRPCVVISFISLSLLSVSIITFFITCGLLYDGEHTLKKYFYPSTCQVKDISYHLTWCTARWRQRFRCYQIHWHVTYSLLQNLTEYCDDQFNATIQSSYARHYEQITDAINAAQEYQVNMSYPCWYDTRDLSVVQWYGSYGSAGLILLICAASFIPLSILTLCFDGKRKLFFHSDRVKCVDIHPNEPWILATLYNGHAHIYNHDTQQLIKTFEICDVPVRTGKFVVRKNWIITASDDMFVRVYDYNTLERVHQFEAHSDYIRSIVVHPTQSCILTCSDDMTIKLWDWDAQWALKQTFEGHTHYVMQIAINSKDDSNFASASLDHTIKVWQLGSTEAAFTLEGHEKGVNCVNYCLDDDKPYLVSGGDDHLVKIWDYQNKTCIQTLEGHSQNVSCVAFHPELPIILSGSEDGTVKLWHSDTYCLESTLNFGLGRCWTISCLKCSNNAVLGYDEGTLMIKLDREEPTESMNELMDKIVD
ncbi:unnamed protein product [Rotaria sordida]|uniref:Beta'-coat protein n=1 Tax=Rotaria sordida TaxID=392033 RepID=A0A815FUA0_9BILA|nr:unnamed protein product [Rotaria sordida]CAF1590740.1 unnamed protein product [Rotaria sordida]